MKIYWIGYWFATRRGITAASPDGWLDGSDIDLAIVEFTAEDAIAAFGKRIAPAPEAGCFFLMESEL